MFITYAFTGIILSPLLSLLWVYILDIPKEIITIINDTVAFPLTFFLNKHWSFRQNT
jgi:putative flippase GtrA